MEFTPANETGFLSKNGRKVLWVSILLLPILGALWLGMNMVRVETYDYAADYQRHLGDFRQILYWDVVKAQEIIVLIAKVDIPLGVLCGLILCVQKTLKD